MSKLSRKESSYILGISRQQLFNLGIGRNSKDVLAEIKHRQAESSTAVRGFWKRYKEIMASPFLKEEKTPQEEVEEYALSIGWYEDKPIIQWINEREAELAELKMMELELNHSD